MKISSEQRPDHVAQQRDHDEQMAQHLMVDEASSGPVRSILDTDLYVSRLDLLSLVSGRHLTFTSTETDDAASRA